MRSVCAVFYFSLTEKLTKWEWLISELPVSEISVHTPRLHWPPVGQRIMAQKPVEKEAGHLMAVKKWKE